MSNSTNNGSYRIPFWRAFFSRTVYMGDYCREIKPQLAFDNEIKDLENPIQSMKNDYRGYTDTNLETVLELEDSNKRGMISAYESGCTRLYNIFNSSCVIFALYVSVISFIMTDYSIYGVLLFLYIIPLLLLLPSIVISFHVYRQTIQFGRETYEEYRRFKDDYRSAILSCIWEARLTAFDNGLAYSYKKDASDKASLFLVLSIVAIALLVGITIITHCS